MKKKIYKKPFAKIIKVDMECILQNISGTGESSIIDWSAPKIHDTLLDDGTDETEQVTEINSIYLLNNK